MTRLPPGDRAELQEELALARRATAYFLRCLALTVDERLPEESALPGWTRAQLIADVAWQARGMANCIEGLEIAIDDSLATRADRILFGATLSPIALRHLVHHSAVHLNVVWRDVLDTADGNVTVEVLRGQPISALESVRLRTETLWLRSLDLGGLATLRDAPAIVSNRLLEQVRPWAAGEGLRIVVDDGNAPASTASFSPKEVRGTPSQLGRWAAGRAPRRSPWQPHRRPFDEPPIDVALRSVGANLFVDA